MRDIKVGNFIRTNKGVIGKLIRIERDDIDISLKWYVFSDGKNEIYVNKPYIVNYSQNLIDLIEVGDYVNGYKVLEIADSIYKNSKRILIYRNEKERYERWIYIQEFDGKIYTQDDIVEIVTKELFSSVKYEVER